MLEPGRRANLSAAVPVAVPNRVIRSCLAGSSDRAAKGLDSEVVPARAEPA